MRESIPGPIVVETERPNNENHSMYGRSATAPFLLHRGWSQLRQAMSGSFLAYAGDYRLGQVFFSFLFPVEA